jgi:signal transduction histidine kinase
MRRAVVFVLENEEPTRLALKLELENGGFEVQAAATVAAARQLIELHGSQFDVAVLDMRLEDKDAPHVSGAGIGLEIARQHPAGPPEFIIYSAFPRVDYYRQALRLGAAFFLEKNNRHKAKDVARYVRALVLRRALSTAQPRMLEAIQKIVGSSETRQRAIERFCGEVLRGEIARALHSPFMLLLTSAKDGSLLFGGGSSRLPEARSDVYRDLQNLVFLPGGDVEPLVIAPDQMRVAGVRDDDDVLASLRNAAFVPLAETEEVRLSLGILQEGTQRTEEGQKLAAVIAQVCRGPVLDHLFSLARQWAEARKRQAIVTATAKFCLHVGQEQVAILDDAAQRGELIAGEKPGFVRRLQALGEDLRDAGELLEELGEEAQRSEVQGADLVRKVWKSIARQPELHTDEVFKVEGDCTVYANPDDFHVAVSQILRWFLQRSADQPANQLPSLRVRLANRDGRGEIWFEDSSYRIPDRLREQLFEPFAQGSDPAGEASKGRRLGLYLAKMVIETRNDGSVEDRSNDLGGEIGHRLLLWLPSAPPAEAAA